MRALVTVSATWRRLTAAAMLMLACPSGPAHAQVVVPEPAGSTAEPGAAEPRETEIALESPDAAIQARLRGIFADIDALEEVRVTVSSGIVHLAGSTLTPDDRRRAESIAARLSGVIAVDNGIETDTRVRQRIEPLADRARELGRDAVSYLPLLVVALLVFLAFRFFGRLLIRLLKPFRQRLPNLFVDELLGQAIGLAFTVAGLIVAMNILGLSALLTTVLGAAGVLGLAVGFAVRDTIENYIASILLSLRQPFGPGDHVLVAGHEGRIALLNSRATVVVSLDGNEVRIPNATVYKSVITNFTHLPERRFEFEMSIAQHEDPGRALRTAMQTLALVPGVLAEPAPSALVDRFGEAALILKIYGWVDQTNVDLAKAKSAAIRGVKAAFEKAGISMPAPFTEVRVRRQADDPPHVPHAADSGAELSDTTIDPTILRKADAVRATSGTNLLDHAAERE